VTRFEASLHHKLTLHAGSFAKKAYWAFFYARPLFAFESRLLNSKRLYQKPNTSPVTVPSGILLLTEEEKVKALLIFTFSPFAKATLYTHFHYFNIRLLDVDYLR
jgi:hypothetical protein